MVGFWFLLYLSNTDEKSQIHSIDGRKMLKIGNLIASFKILCRTWLDGIITVIFAEQAVIGKDIYLAFYASVKGGLCFERSTLNISYLSVNWDLNIS